jgi:hypothetical protein
MAEDRVTWFFQDGATGIEEQGECSLHDPLNILADYIHRARTT